jgi:hypothetical protein
MVRTPTQNPSLSPSIAAPNLEYEPLKSFLHRTKSFDVHHIHSNNHLDEQQMKEQKSKRSGITRTLTSSFDVTPRKGSESTNMGLEPTAFR